MKTWQHILFWVVVHGGLTILFAGWFGDWAEAFYYVSLLLPVVVGTTYFFNYFLVPRYLFKRRFLSFGLYSFYMLVASLCLELVASVVAMLIIIRFRINETGPLVTDVFTLALIMYFIVFLTSFILLIKHYFIDQRTIRELEENQLKMEEGALNVRSNRNTSRINYRDVLYIESLADYVKIHRVYGEPVHSREKISHLEQLLPAMFIRIHRSFIVNRSTITAFSREQLRVGEKELPISRSYRKKVIAELEGGTNCS